MNTVDNENISFKIDIEPVRSRLRIVPGNPDVIRIESPRSVPNTWIRFWYWILLGWKWEKINQPVQNQSSIKKWFVKYW